MNVENVDVIKYYGYKRVIDIMMYIEKVNKTGKYAKFNDMSFDLRLNPGLLDRLLKIGLELKVIQKSPTMLTQQEIAKEGVGYWVTVKGRTTLYHAKLMVGYGLESVIGEEIEVV